MVEHAPWVGPDYGKPGTSLGGRRVAIILYSHWLYEGWKDTNEATIDCISKVISGELRIAAFTQVRDYFGYDNHQAFWQQVMFFNYLPNCVGGGDERYNNGTSEQIKIAEPRFLRLIEEHQPDKVLIFTARSRDFPPVENRLQIVHGFPRFKWGTYGGRNHRAMAFFLRHPQRANGELMRSAVKIILDLPNVKSSPN
jgi:hypothetical protein